MNIALSICIYKFADAQLQCSIYLSREQTVTHDNNTAMPLVGVLVT